MTRRKTARSEAKKPLRERLPDALMGAVLGSILTIITTVGLQTFYFSPQDHSDEREQATAQLERVMANFRARTPSADAFALSDAAWAAFHRGDYQTAADLAIRANERARLDLRSGGAAGGAEGFPAESDAPAAALAPNS